MANNGSSEFAQIGLMELGPDQAGSTPELSVEWTNGTTPVAPDELLIYPSGTNSYIVLYDGSTSQWQFKMNGYVYLTKGRWGGRPRVVSGPTRSTPIRITCRAPVPTRRTSRPCK